MLEELKNKVGELLDHANQVQDALNAADQVVSAPTAEKAIVEAMVAALQAQGYTVTAPEAAPAE